MDIKKFKLFKENLELEENIEESRFSDYSHIKEDLMEMIEKSVNSTDSKLINEFINAYIEDSETTLIEGLVNDSDIYEFYLKYISEIDEVLNDVDFFKSNPESLGTLGLYDFMVKGTREALIELFRGIKNDLDL